MEVLWGAQQRPAEAKPTVATVGMFDGVHRGHRHLFDRVLDEARKLGARAGVVTFDPHPLEVLAPEKAPCMLTTLDQRLLLFEEAGFDVVLVLDFDRRLAALNPAEFAQEALVEELRVRKILVGSDFRFGHDRAGDVETLRELGTASGYEAEAIGLLGNGDDKISSTEIRRRLRATDVSGVSGLLGRPYRLAGRVVRGDERGRALGFPTANLDPHPRACLPGLGVYAGWWVEGGKRLPGAINVGVRPTFGSDEVPLCEIHVLDFSGDLYGAEGEVEFTDFIRPELRFEGAEELVERMKDDVKATRLLLGL